MQRSVMASSLKKMVLKSIISIKIQPFWWPNGQKLPETRDKKKLDPKNPSDKDQNV